MLYVATTQQQVYLLTIYIVLWYNNAHFILFLDGYLMLSKTDPTAIMENKVVQEILETEATFQTALANMKLVFGMEVVQEISPKFKGFLTQIITLETISTTLLNNVKKAVLAKTSDLERATLRLQRQQLLKAFFEAYLPYAKLHKEFDSIYQAKPEKFLIVENLFRKECRTKLGLVPHLATPIQRGTRYAILLSAAIDTNKHIDAKQLDDLKALRALVMAELGQANAKLAETEKPYQFGDYTRAAVVKVSDYMGTIWSAQIVEGANLSAPTVAAEKK